MTRTTLTIALALLPACAVQELESIIAMYDTFGSTDSTGGTGSSTADGSTTGTSSADTTTSSTTAADSTTGGAEAGMDATSGSTTGAESTSTGAPPPFCGDGVVDPDETCDDMNDDPDDGCKLCTKDRLVFVSSVRYKGYYLDGLFGADQRCRMLAALAGLPNFGTYRAWLSDSNTAAADRMVHSKGRYTLVNGLLVARDWDTLVSGNLDEPINVTESSQTPEGTCTWTGTHPNGQPAFGSSFCNDWTDDNFQLGGRGINDQLGPFWSFFEQAGCESNCSIYCFEN